MLKSISSFKIKLLIAVLIAVSFAQSIMTVGCMKSSTDTKPLGNSETSNQYQWLPEGASRILWVGAHPDDEVYVAPLLAELCLKRNMSCTLLVMTDGGKGNCLLAEGCLPSVAQVRAEEMRQTAVYFKATLETPNFEDSPASTPDDVLISWNNSIGGGNKLLTSLTDFIKKVNPDVILTFDPRHGSSCHLDHRAVGRLVLDATLAAGKTLQSVYFPQAYWESGLVNPTQAWAGNAVIIPTDDAVFKIDSINNWSAFIDNLSIHKSQFRTTKNEYIDAFGHAPLNKRIVPLLRASDTVMSDSRYQNLCPKNDAQWPGQH